MLFANNIMKLLFVQSACKDLYKILLMKKVRNPTINSQENAVGFEPLSPWRQSRPNSIGRRADIFFNIKLFPIPLRLRNQFIGIFIIYSFLLKQIRSICFFLEKFDNAMRELYNSLFEAKNGSPPIVEQLLLKNVFQK